MVPLQGGRFFVKGKYMKIYYSPPSRERINNNLFSSYINYADIALDQVGVSHEYENILYNPL
jgi:hypothetical protein